MNINEYKSQQQVFRLFSILTLRYVNLCICLHTKVKYDELNRTFFGVSNMKVNIKIGVAAM